MRRTCIRINNRLNRTLAALETLLNSVLKCIYVTLGCYLGEGTDPAEADEAKPKTPGRISPLEARKLLPVADWPHIVEATLKGIKGGIAAYDKANAEHEHFLSLNWNNVSAMLSEIYGAYVIGSMAFDSTVGWSFSSLSTIILSALKMNSNSSSETSPYQFVAMFWVSFGLCFFYILLAIPAANKARLGVLGLVSSPPQIVGH